jgi:energy-coupling factor transporter ATP-binding protein EcfA2
MPFLNKAKRKRKGLVLITHRIIKACEYLSRVLSNVMKERKLIGFKRAKSKSEIQRQEETAKVERARKYYNQ